MMQPLNIRINHKNYLRLNSLIDNVLLDYSKILPVRVDLYLPDNVNNKLNFDNLFTRFLNNIRWNSSFNNLIAHATKLEYGHKRLWHMHCLFLFDGQKHNNGFAMAQLIGSYWQETITSGLGVYFSSNMNPYLFDNFTLKVIDYYDDIAIHNLKVTSSYLAKETVIFEGVEGMIDASGKRYRSFRASPYKPKNNGLGRHRKYAAA